MSMVAPGSAPSFGFSANGAAQAYSVRAAGRYPGYKCSELRRLTRLPPKVRHRFVLPGSREFLPGRSFNGVICLLRARTVSAFHAALSVAILTSCAPLEQRPPEVRTQTITVQIPIATPCFTEDQRPILPLDTPVDPDTATTEQLVAAKLADAIAREIYAAKVDALFTACSKGPQ